jgi:hypothetical protein
MVDFGWTLFKRIDTRRLPAKYLPQGVFQVGDPEPVPDLFPCGEARAGLPPLFI